MKKHHALATVFVLLLNSCATYHISTESLLEQFADTHPEKKVTLLLVPPFFIPFSVKGNDLKTITVLTKENKKYVLPIDHRTGIRIYKKDGTKTTFYFNTLLVKDSTITGSKTHFFNAQIKPIKLADISKMELQR